MATKRKAAKSTAKRRKTTKKTTGTKRKTTTKRGDEVVTFERAIVKVKTWSCGQTIKNANPDGTPHYVNTSVMTSVIPPNKTFTVDKTQAKTTTKSPPGQMFS